MSRHTSRTDPCQLLLPVLAELIPQGDGTFILKPKVVDSDMDTWINYKAVVQILGCGRATVYRLADAGQLTIKRPSRGKVLFSLKSVQAHNLACRDPEFWTKN